MGARHKEKVKVGERMREMKERREELTEAHGLFFYSKKKREGRMRKAA